MTACACRGVYIGSRCAAVQGGIAKRAEKQLSGIENWHVTQQQMPYIDFFQERKADLVYLTADSPNELSELDSSKLYIIGGIVDRNRHKNICFNKAVSQVGLLHTLHFMTYRRACVYGCVQVEVLVCLLLPAVVSSRLGLACILSDLNEGCNRVDLHMVIFCSESWHPDRCTLRH